MKIVCFYGDNPLASWSLSRGLPAVLRRMGHEVTEIRPLPTAKVKRSDAERINKPIPKDTDLVLVSGPEYLITWIKYFYPQWQSLKVPKAGWYHESEVRDDRRADFSKITPYFDFNFMPNAEDAERHGAEHLPVGVDTQVFYRSWDEATSCIGHSNRTIDCAFIGSLYEKRKQFLQGTAPHLGKAQIRAGQALVQTLDGIDLERSVQLLASEYRRIKVLLNLPTLSRVLVSKILEAAACGCCVLTPKPVYANVGAPYDPEPAALAAEIKRFTEDSELAEKQAATDCEIVHKEHRLELRFEKMFAACELEVAVPA